MNLNNKANEDSNFYNAIGTITVPVCKEHLSEKQKF